MAAREDDVFGLCCVLWELCTRTLPWAGYTPDQIFEAVREGEVILAMRNRNTPTLLLRLLREGLVWARADRDLDYEEIRDMLLLARRLQEKSDLQQLSPSSLQSELRTKYELKQDEAEVQPDHSQEEARLTRTINNHQGDRQTGGQTVSLNKRFSREGDSSVFRQKYEQLTRQTQQKETVKSVKPVQSVSPPKPVLRPQVSEEKSSGNTLNVSSWSQYESALESPNTSSLSTSGGRKVGAFMAHLERCRARPVTPVLSGNTRENKQDLPQRGVVNNFIKFYDERGVGGGCSPLDRTEYHSILTPYHSALTSPVSSPSIPAPPPPGGKKTTRDQTVQTEAPPTTSAGLMSSTPVSGSRQFLPVTPSLSPLDGSPLFTKKRAAHIGKVSGLVASPALARPVEESFFSVTSPGPVTSDSSRPVDFSNPEGRQDLFKSALGLAASQLDQSYQGRKQPVVTFNNNVEEITTSIVSIVDSEHSGANLQEDFASAHEPADTDIYLDDGLPTKADEEPINMQLLSQQGAGRKVGDRVLAQYPGDGGWYPATVSILSGHQATVAFEHNLQLKTVEVVALRSSEDTGDSRYDTVREEEEDREKEEQEVEDEDNEKEEDEEDNKEEEEDEEDTTGYRTSLETAWKVGDRCVARWDEEGGDDLWYRAVIDGLEGERALVTFTEYGNSAYTQVGDLRDQDTHINDQGLLEEEEEEVEDEWS